MIDPLPCTHEELRSIVSQYDKWHAALAIEEMEQWPIGELLLAMWPSIDEVYEQTVGTPMWDDSYHKAAMVVYAGLGAITRGLARSEKDEH